MVLGGNAEEQMPWAFLGGCGTSAGRQLHLISGFSPGIKKPGCPTHENMGRQALADLEGRGRHERSDTTDT